jgi:hypothetical protein
LSKSDNSFSSRKLDNDFLRVQCAANSAVNSQAPHHPSPQVLWAVPGFIGATWFIWHAFLSDKIQQSVGLHCDPDASLNKVEPECTQRLEAKEALNNPKASGEEEEQEEEDEEEEEAVTHKDVAVAVSKAVELAGGEDDDKSKSFEACPREMLTEQ